MDALFLFFDHWPHGVTVATGIVVSPVPIITIELQIAPVIGTARRRRPAVA